MKRWAGRYVGIPFQNRGRDRDGADCWGLLRMVYRDELGIDLPSYGEISALDLARVATELKTGAEQWFEPDRPSEFDGVLIRVSARGRNWISHVGLMAPGRMILHTEKATDAVLQSMDDILLRDRIVGFRRHVSRA